MKYHNITHDDMKNGDGLRVVLWVSGCEHHCEGCQNPITWNPDDGLEFDINTLIELEKELEKDYISGLTLSGGDPLSKFNLEQISMLVVWSKLAFPEKTIWLYTGFTWEEIIARTYYLPLALILSCVDILVDGKFEQDKLDVNYPWAGSTNQRVIDVQETLKKGMVIRYGSNKERWYERAISSDQNSKCCD